MKKILIAGLVAIAATGFSSCGNSAQSAANGLGDSIATTLGTLNGSQLNLQYEMIPEADRAKMSKDQILAGIKYIMSLDTADLGYMSGLQIGMSMLGNLQSLEAQGAKMDFKKAYAAFEAAFKADSINQTDIMMYQAQFQTMTTRLREEAEAKIAAEKAASPEAKKNAEDGRKYIAEQKAADPEIKTTASGLSYKVVQPGKGTTTPTDADQVKVHYVGRLVDGTVFDSSVDRGAPAVFPVNALVPGFTEALKMMTPGEKMTVYIPGDLAYGVNSPSPMIGPNATLVFDIELIEINPAN
ncbi:MAG: FKBP-type peptidyl-prolyl cis-trans isomerase [Muribaculaceae bacterium]|nr:FKBP-type peptidyl-prolyl cis-trans isomerase [Muribaculaceae bacterium]